MNHERFLATITSHYAIAEFVGLQQSTANPQFAVTSTLNLLSTLKVWLGVQQKILRESQNKKTEIFTLVHIKAPSVYIQGSKVKVERTSCKAFSSGSTAFKAWGIRFRSRVVSSEPNRHRSIFFQFLTPIFGGRGAFGTGVHKVRQLPVSMPNFSQISWRTAEIRLAKKNKS